MLKVLLQKITTKLYNNKKIFKYGITFKSKDDIYNYETSLIIKKILKTNSNAIDIGSHKGKFLFEFLKCAPNGNHFAFEPLPYLYEKLIKIFPKNCKIYKLALSNKKENVIFNYVKDYPGFSGLMKRTYPSDSINITGIKVQTELLDNIIPKHTRISFIKIDVEGAEYLVFQGGYKTITKWKPIIVFEFGLGAADCYGITPEKMYDLLNIKYKLRISTMDRYLGSKRPINKKTFADWFNNNTEYYYIAY